MNLRFFSILDRLQWAKKTISRYCPFKQESEEHGCGWGRGGAGEERPMVEEESEEDSNEEEEV